MGNALKWTLYMYLKFESTLQCKGLYYVACILTGKGASRLCFFWLNI